MSPEGVTIITFLFGIVTGLYIWNWADSRMSKEKHEHNVCEYCWCNQCIDPPEDETWDDFDCPDCPVAESCSLISAERNDWNESIHRTPCDIYLTPADAIEAIELGIFEEEAKYEG